MAVIGLAWQGFFIFTLVIVGTEIIRFLLAGYRKIDFYAYLLWVIPIFISVLGSKRNYYNISDPSVFLAILIPSFILFLTPIYLLSYKISIIVKHKSLFTLTVGVGILILVLVALTIFTSLSPRHMLVEIWERINFPFGQNRLTKFIGELKKETLLDWYIWPGSLFLGILGGALILIFRVAKNLGINAWITASVFEILVIGVIFSRVLSSSQDTSISNAIYIISVAGILIEILIISIWLSSKENLRFKIEQDAIFLLVYFIIMLLLARSAIRFKFFLAPIEVILGSLAIVWLLQRLVKKEQLDKVVYFLVGAMIIWEFFAIQDVLFLDFPQNTSFGLALALTLMFSIFVIDYKEIWIQIKQFRLSILKSVLIWGGLAVVLFVPTPLKLGMVSSYAEASSKIVMMQEPLVAKMLQALAWLREKTSPNSVVAASWEYGSWINLMSERATIVDEAQQIPYWIYMMSRHVMVGQTEREALAFLKAHEATHLLLTARDISLIPKVSYIGSDECLDRNISLPCFGPIVERVDSDGGTVAYRYRIPEIISTDDLQLKKSYEIVGIYLKLEEKNQDLAAATIELRYGEEIKRIPPEEIYFRGNLIRQQKENSLPCTILINAETHDPWSWSIIYLSKAARSSLAIQLYLLDKKSEFFTPVYPPASSKQPNYYARIWKISYPKGLAVDQEYLQMKFADPKLIKAWKEIKR